MAKHIYDEKGKYKGKILSDEEHNEKKRVQVKEWLKQQGSIRKQPTEQKKSPPSKEYLNNQIRGLSLLFRKNPSFTWGEMSIKNKMVSILQILFVIFFIFFFISSGGF
ncbi:MAG: hypothetical protein CMP56_05105 [Flavobacteriales bacterium]|nr:hypothetical protein [Flavobacteriales bacterium]|tara:strand:+ start:504 stop:827 length:324 start_codon:yes stop_codon:yes gene_type:complete